MFYEEETECISMFMELLQAVAASAATSGNYRTQAH